MIAAYCSSIEDHLKNEMSGYNLRLSFKPEEVRQALLPLLHIKEMATFLAKTLREKNMNSLKEMRIAMQVMHFLEAAYKQKKCLVIGCECRM